jgi:hypothetical protein
VTGSHELIRQAMDSGGDNTVDIGAEKSELWTQYGIVAYRKSGQVLAVFFEQSGKVLGFIDLTKYAKEWSPYLWKPAKLVLTFAEGIPLVNGPANVLQKLTTMIEKGEELDRKLVELKSIIEAYRLKSGGANSEATKHFKERFENILRDLETERAKFQPPNGKNVGVLGAIKSSVQKGISVQDTQNAMERLNKEVEALFRDVQLENHDKAFTDEKMPPRIGSY